MKQYSLTFIILAIVLLLLLSLDLNSARPGRKPNVIVILMDDLGWHDVGFNGGGLKTPNIERLTESGTILKRFYVSNVCTPSRVALLSGRYPGRLGMSDGPLSPERMDGLPERAFLLSEFLAEQGYSQIACIGKWHLGHADAKYHPLNHGFTYFYGSYGGSLDHFNHMKRNELDWHKDFKSCKDEGYTTDLVANEAVRFIEDRAEADPFFLYLPFHAPQAPLQATEYYLEEVGYDMNRGIFSDGQARPLDRPRRAFEVGRGNTKRQTYRAMLRNADAAIGRILDCLEREGLMENSLIVFCSDNGGSLKAAADNGPLRDGKFSNYEGGVRVPAIIKWPASLSAPLVSHIPLAHVDLFSTIASLLGQTSPAGLDGVDMLSAVTGQQDVSERVIYLGKDQGGAVVKQNWKLIGEELYDLNNDPGEMANVADYFPEIYQALLAEKERMIIDIEQASIAKEGYKLQKDWAMPIK